MLVAIVNLGLKLFDLAAAGLRALRPLAPWILAAAVGALAYHFLPAWGAGARLDALEARRAAIERERDDWRTAAGGWESSFRSAEDARLREQGVAQAAANSLIEQCGARVEEARRSARVIERIVTREPTYDENRCPVRELVDPGSLRDALSPAGPR